MAVQSPQRDTPPVPERRPRAMRWAAAAALLGALMMYNSLTHAQGQAPVSGPVVTSQSAASGQQGPQGGQGQQEQPGTPPPTGGPSMARSEPTLLSIPDIGVSAPFTKLSLGADGRLEAPPEDNSNLAGWYGDGPTPGERGNAIVAGHVDTKTGPAVFELLSLLKKGQPVAITRADNSVARFTVDSVETFAKDDFPDQRVYGDTPDAELRIITCGGTFDHKKQDYQDNVVVFAHLDQASQG
ncbi:Sortase family protein [Streptomyces sp. DvalAA-14]|uniref:class F sortase n=1 Tax=unclassified Streptomyces TaxID=2593676 RepID=UPI00081B7EB7|nr:MULTISPECIES: class F sortase [unclassified Streptomyces]MYS22936.1 class F sortase [Streptomyces sp. SID4948]SCE24852.1 Sortase family protein [Streptomyces sp. DvalAA-14]